MFTIVSNLGSANSVSGIAAGSTIGGANTGRYKKTSYFQKCLDGNGVHPAVYSLGTGFLFRGYVREVEHSLLCSAIVGNEWLYGPASQMCLHDVQRDNYTHYKYYVLITYDLRYKDTY